MSTLPSSFITKKQKILSSLSTPSIAYTDLSPKGSVDAAILPLIHEVNSLEGLVTTSSCAGRISVFLEGRKSDAAVGGKGAGGRWLFVSHEPLDLDQHEDLEKLFGLVTGIFDGQPAGMAGRRTVRFQFEPMVGMHASYYIYKLSATKTYGDQILHILAASLSRAQPVLAAAINAGFRESGVQSLRSLDNVEACPMIAVRTTGLALESIVGVVCGDQNGGEEMPIAVVGREYLGMLAQIANERFAANSERMERFRMELIKTYGKSQDVVRQKNKARRVWKQAEGLETKRNLGRITSDGANGKDDTIFPLGELYLGEISHP